MSFGWTAATWISVAGTAVSAIQAYQQSQDAGNAQKQQMEIQIKNDKEKELAMNKANARQPNTAAALAANAMAGRAGQSGTLLTGPQGVNSSQLTLGKQSVLGSS